MSVSFISLSTLCLSSTKKAFIQLRLNDPSRDRLSLHSHQGPTRIFSLNLARGLYHMVSALSYAQRRGIQRHLVSVSLTAETTPSTDTGFQDSGCFVCLGQARHRLAAARARVIQTQFLFRCFHFFFVCATHLMQLLRPPPTVFLDN